MYPIYFDTETCGLHGMAVLLQYAEGDGEVHLHELWRRPVSETLSLIEKIFNHPEGIIGFNLAFDVFHLVKIYTVFRLCPPDWLPVDHIDDIAILEAHGRDGPCLKPITAFDIMLHARRGRYQSMMNRDEVRIKKVPSAIAWDLANELERRIPIDNIYFAKRKDKNAANWKVADISNDLGDTIVGFKDVVCRFYPSSALKTLAAEALGIKEPVPLFGDIEVDEKLKPVEYGYAPFATAGILNKDGTVTATGPGHWHGTWPSVIRHHINHWAFYKPARDYANKDVIYTRELYKFFGSPSLGDRDSILACMVAANRWRGYAVDVDGLRKLRVDAVVRSHKTPKAPERAKAYLYEVMGPTERLAMGKSTAKAVLKGISDWRITNADGTETEHPAATRAKEILEARRAAKEVELYDKLIHAGRFHASFVVLGTKSARMSGSDDLNPQGIKHSKVVRAQFPLALFGMELDGGDFDAFEVTIAEAVYGDEKLRADLLSGKKIHALFALEMFPDEEYDDILESEGTDNDMYGKGKGGVFTMLFGGEAQSLSYKQGIALDIAQKAFEGFGRTYPGVGRFRAGIKDKFCSMRQPGGIGSRVEWHDPADYIESMFGFRRYFTLENKICKTLFELAEKPPKHWQSIKLKVVRRERVQTATGATQSALFGAAFQIQAHNMRAAANHLIQSPGAEITKELQVRLWALQPCGINSWHIQPLNIHDEIMSPALKTLRDAIDRIVKELITEYKKVIPLLSISWRNGVQNWAEAKAKEKKVEAKNVAGTVSS